MDRREAQMMRPAQQPDRRGLVIHSLMQPIVWPGLAIRRRALPAALALLALAGLPLGCTPQKPPAPGTAGPVEAVQAFSAAVQRGDAAGAWALLSTKTQQEADALAAEALKKSGGAGPQ